MKTSGQKKFLEPLLFEISKPGRAAFSLPENDCPAIDPGNIMPSNLIRDSVNDFPEVSENEIVRHFTRLSQLNYAIDTGFYPLGSCTMKYNPKVNEVVARLPAFTSTHPFQPVSQTQGNLQLLWELEQFLAEITGMARVTLQPAAGAHGELTGMMMIKAYHLDRGQNRHIVLVPDSAHGTNPATSTLCGYKVQVIPSNERGLIDFSALNQAMSEDVAAIMITNPNTLGLFETEIEQIAALVHQKGGLVYCDGANMNALLGISRPGDMGIDVLHLNLHKTFSTPHGGGGPGSGPVAVQKQLQPFLPVPVIDRDAQGCFFLSPGDERSIGKISTFLGNFAVAVKAYTYINSLGPAGLKKVSQIAVLNANYVRQTLKPTYHIPFDTLCKHECVFNDKLQQQYQVSTLDIAKRLIDYGFHPPTIYFPLIVKGALMIEPTETETPEMIDHFVATMKQISREAAEDPEMVRSAPFNAPLKRLDEVLAARKPKLRFNYEAGSSSAPGK
ncbi:aminomethyl-transferring glycine dehydrogenase subunit GcvPB [candidate division CSSED10-310 bacterium]|uniref:Probable glycine dehydrogenase (decarboxylating) subunit 2 n=1 Tax=candidate division CSSED10-310 bacterium TaxID=2855610 RepID=A0ABV6Z2M7_UNCC1